MEHPGWLHGTEEAECPPPGASAPCLGRTEELPPLAPHLSAARTGAAPLVLEAKPRRALKGCIGNDELALLAPTLMKLPVLIHRNRATTPELDNPGSLKATLIAQSDEVVKVASFVSDRGMTLAAPLFIASLRKKALGPSLNLVRILFEC